MDTGVTYVILGATGDLATRKLIPALFRLYTKQYKGGQDFNVIAFARKDKTDQQYRDEVKVDEAQWDDFAQHITYHRGEFHDKQSYVSLAQRLRETNQSVLVFYLATSPDFFELLLDNLEKQDLLAQNDERKVRVVVEKPFGNDGPSAHALNEKLLSHVKEEQIYRIDHYLAKQLVQNILVLRFANSIFEHLWNHKHIEHVQITVSETVGVGTRKGYYDGVGATKDMIQNHLLQILALVAMEPPSSMHANDIRDEKSKVLKLLRWHADSWLVKGQYEGYTQEIEHDSSTETYTALKAYIDNWRWSDVPFYLRTGKEMSVGAAEIVIVFEKAPSMLFSQDLADNVLRIRIQPDESISLHFNVKPPHEDISSVHMEFCHSCQYSMNTPQAYEYLLNEVALGDQTLFTRADTVEAAWRFIDQLPTVETLPYAKRSWGPKRADEKMQQDNRAWIQPMEEK